LELLATAALLLGHVEDDLRALQRAHQRHAEGGDPRRAARCAFWLTFHLGARGDVAQASGWFGRASRLLEHEQECAEHGYLLISVAFHQLVAGDYAAGRTAAAQAAAIGGRTGDGDLVPFARYLQGRALVHDGEMDEGLALVDEAMVAVVAGELSPIVAGAVYCGVIETCQVLSELRRASEWTAALTAWCGTQPDMVTFTGQCLVHRAELLHLHGAWPQAVEEAKRALERFAHGADEFASGTPALRAMADHARGAVLLADGDARAALVALRGAWQLWRELQAPYEAARGRVLVGLACRQLGDQEAAAMELDAARTVFAQLGAAPDLARVEALARSDAASNAHGLTERELQVLRLLATGTTNHAIASELSVTVKTVDRHVSNIFTKLGVASRDAATAYAYQHRLL
jgi:ATP/maltotriose-dependent transcriptional regulator MalT